MAILMNVSVAAETIPEQETTTERLFWKKQPLYITLSVGKERLVTFPGPIRIGIPSTITPLLRSISNQGTAYWLASDEFESTRVQIQDVETGQIFLIDLEASKNKDLLNTPIEVIVKQPSDPQQSAAGQGKTHQINLKPLGYVSLTRFAAQQLYAPARLLKTPAGVSRVPVQQTATRLLIRGHGITATPLAAWRSGPWYVTAVRLENQESISINLDPRTLRGQWRAATFQHARLLPTGSDADTTAVYLISDQPFADSLGGLF